MAMDYQQMLAAASAPPPNPQPGSMIPPTLGQPMPSAGTPPPDASGGMGSYAGMTQPQDPTLTAINKPAQTPAEVETRKSGWQAVWDKFTTDPNLQRAMLMVGAHMMQPLAPGQTTMGHLGQSLALGSQAINAGEYANYEKSRQDTKDQQETAESGARVAASKASTAETQARTPGTIADSKVKTDTAQARIDEANTASATAKLALAKATSQEEVDKIQRDLDKHKLQIEQAVPDAVRKKAVMAELEAAGLKADEAKARINASKAAAGASGSAARANNLKADESQITLDVLKKMPDSEKKEFLTKTGKYSTSASGVTQQASLWGDLYDKLPATDSSKSGKTREQFQMKMLTEAKSKDALESLTKYMAANGDDPEIIQGLTELIKGNMSAKKAAAGTPGPGTRPPLDSFQKK